jgi:hypothetical protein
MRRTEMAKWRKKESLGKALAREGGSIAKGVGKELLSIATLELYRPSKRGARSNARRRK